MNRQNSTSSDKEKTPRTISLSVPKGFEKEVAYLHEQPNKSQYVWRLIRDDMNKQNENERILEILRDTMKDLTLQKLQNRSDK